MTISGAKGKRLNRRPLGNSGIMVSEVGFGGWQLANPAWGLHDPVAASQLVGAALDAGCDFFDTAPGYTKGQSETLLGQALEGVRGSVTICTKFGHGADGRTSFDVSAVRPSVEGSLRRLRTDYLDVLLLHNPPEELLDGTRSPLMGELEKLKAEGKVRVYGASLDWRRELETIITTTNCGAVEILFNAFHQDPLAAFSAAAKKGIGLIVKVPLDSGWLSGKYRGDSTFTGIRSRWSPEVIARRGMLVEKLAALLPKGVSLGHAALRYVLAQSEVSTVIPGAKDIAQAQDNFAATNYTLPVETVRAIHAMWEGELRDDPLPW